MFSKWSPTEHLRLLQTHVTFLSTNLLTTISNVLHMFSGWFFGWSPNGLQTNCLYKWKYVWYSNPIGCVRPCQLDHFVSESEGEWNPQNKCYVSNPSHTRFGTSIGGFEIGGLPSSNPSADVKLAGRHHPILSRSFSVVAPA